ncbi:MAG: DUF2304 domain-containing protein [Bryobacteraceae bacterium]
MIELLDVLTGLGVLLLLVVLRAIRREHIRVEHSVSWLAAALALIFLSRCGPWLAAVANALGIREPALVLLFLILIVFLGVFYRFSRVVSELKDMNITLTQRVAILEFLLRERDGAA